MIDFIPDPNHGDAPAPEPGPDPGENRCPFCGTLLDGFDCPLCKPVKPFRLPHGRRKWLVGEKREIPIR